MTQVRNAEYQEPLDAFHDNLSRIGMLPPGVYCGFDTITNVVGLVCRLQHTGTGISYLDKDGVTLRGPTGFILDKQGMIIEENAYIPLTVGSNAGNAFGRIDLVIQEHIWDDSVSGGVAATYSIIQGPNGGATPPALTNPNKQVIIGRITMPASTATMDPTYYVREVVKGPGYSNFAYRDQVNRFTKINEWNRGVDITPSASPGYLISLPDDGNAWKIITTHLSSLSGMTAKPEGTIITLIWEDNDIELIGVNSLTNPVTPTDVTNGYAKIDLPDNSLASDYVLTSISGTISQFIFLDGLWRPLSNFFTSTGALYDLLSRVGILENNVLTWHNISLTSPWLAFSLANTCRYAKADNMLFLRIQAYPSANITGTNSIICTLPNTIDIPGLVNNIVTWKETGSNNTVEPQLSVQIDNGSSPNVRLIPQGIQVSFPPNHKPLVEFIIAIPLS